MAWVLAMLALMWWWFGIGMEAWADHHSNSGARQEELGRKGATAALAVGATAVAGPVLVATVAFAGRLRWTGTAFLALAILLAALAAPISVGAYRTLNPPPPPPPAPTTCQERSGGDTRCPGG